jgi:hypothetical protein
MKNATTTFEQVEQARQRWATASARATTIADELFQPGSGYGCPEAEQQDRHRLETARSESDHLFREYQDLDRRFLQEQMLRLQQSQRLATWASFSVAAVVGLATIASIVAQFFK